MNQADRKDFAAVVARTFSVYNQPVTDAMLDMWWAVLEPYTLRAVTAGLSYHVGDYKGYGYRPPTPADIRQALEVTLPAIARARCAEIIGAAEQRAAPYRDEAARAATDRKLGLITLEVLDEVRARTSRAILEIFRDPEVAAAREGVKFRDEVPAARERMPRLVRDATVTIGGPRS